MVNRAIFSRYHAIRNPSYALGRYVWNLKNIKALCHGTTFEMFRLLSLFHVARTLVDSGNDIYRLVKSDYKL